MNKLSFLTILVLLTYSSMAQGHMEREQVYLHLDKYQCWAGDTVYFRGYINWNGVRSRLSTNLYFDLSTESGIPIYKGIAPIIKGIGIGNIKIPDTIATGNYVLRAFTLEQLNVDTSNFLPIPIAVYNKNKPGKPLLKRRIPPSDIVSFTNIDFASITVRIIKDSLAVSLDMDTTCADRNFFIFHPFNSDSGVYAKVTLTARSPSKYVKFPYDSNKTVENILIKEDSHFVSRTYLKMKSIDVPISVRTDTLDTAPYGYNSWDIEIPDSVQYISSVSVVPKDRSISPPITITSLMDSRTENFTTPVKELDTSLITFTGLVRTKYSNKRIKNVFSKSLSITGVKDTTYVFLRNVDQDDQGNFKLDSLRFYGKIKMQFRIYKSGEEDGQNDNLRLELSHRRLPALDTLAYQAQWEDDSAKIAVDTTYSAKETATYDLSKVKTLKAVVVKHYKSASDELNAKYSTGPYSEPMALSFDVRTETRWVDMGSFLRQNMGMSGGFSSTDTPQYPGHPVHFFVNDEVQQWWMVYGMDFRTLAYVKGGELTGYQQTPFERFQNGENVASRFSYSGSGALKVPTDSSPFNVMIYTRKGTDWRSFPTDVNSVEVKGYDSLINFSHDRLTLYWNPIILTNQFRVRFTNGEYANGYRLVIEGINTNGKVIHQEKIIE